MKKSAYTLAEVLITILVIGVISAMTLPSLIKNYQKFVTATHLKKVYSTLEQLIVRADADYGDLMFRQYAGHNFSAINFRNNYMIPYFDGSKALTNEQIKKLYKIKSPGDIFVYPFYVEDKDGNGAKLQLKTGEILFMHTAYGRQGGVCLDIALDLNGAKGPNKSGKDIFYMQISFYDNKLLMYNEKKIKGYELTYSQYTSDSALLDNCINGDGTSCGAVIKRNGWVIPKDYPW